MRAILLTLVLALVTAKPVWFKYTGLNVDYYLLNTVNLPEGDLDACFKQCTSQPLPFDAGVFETHGVSAHR